MVVVGDAPPEGCVADQPPLGLVDEEALARAGVVGLRGQLVLQLDQVVPQAELERVGCYLAGRCREEETVRTTDGSLLSCRDPVTDRVARRYWLTSARNSVM
jgi:hypothetical protein